MTLNLAHAVPVIEPNGLFTVIAPYGRIFLIALAVTLLLTPLMRRLALSHGVIDRPDASRKIHAKPIAYLGGVAIFMGWLLAISACYFIAPHSSFAGTLAAGVVHFPVSIILGATVIMLTGLFDDVYGISPRVKVAGQLFAAAALAHESVGIALVESTLSIGVVEQMLATIGIQGVADWAVYSLGTLVIALFVIGGCNAMNLLDGLDGLAAGVTGIAAIGFLAIAVLIALRTDQPYAADATLDPVRLTMCLAILGAVIGFLPYNFNPASIFMGDAGSLLLGYLSVVTILLFAETEQNGLLMVTAALIVFALPVTDTSLALIRRKLRGQPLFAPDSQHIHHLLRHAGLSVRHTTLTLYLLSAVFALLGFTLVLFELRWRWLLATVALLYLTIMVAAFWYGHHQHKQDLLRQRAQSDPEPTPDPDTAGTLDPEIPAPDEPPATQYPPAAPPRPRATPRS